MSISINFTASTVSSLTATVSGTNTQAGPVIVRLYGPTSEVASQQVATGASYSFSGTASDLACGTLHFFTGTLSGATSGTLYESTTSGTYTDACPPPFFPPYFPPYFPPFFPPYFPPYFPPFFPPYFPPYFPPFFPPRFPAAPYWVSGSDVLSSSTETEGVAITETTFSAVNASTYALYSGTLPVGVTLSSSGVLSGTPVQGSANTYNFVVSANGDGGTIVTETLTMTVEDDGGDISIYNSSTSSWDKSPVYVYDGTQWVRSFAHIYNSGSSSWDRST